MATTDEINLGFRLAGFPEGRPTAENSADVIWPANSAAVADAFSDDVLDQLLRDNAVDPASTSEVTPDIPGFAYGLAASILLHLLNCGLDTDGRPLSLTTSSVGGISATYESSSSTRDTIGFRAGELQRLSRQAAVPAGGSS